MKEKINIFWFRRDLRLHDNPGLYKALGANNVYLIFIFDTHILNQLSEVDDARVSLIYDQLQNINNQLKPYHTQIRFFKGKPIQVFKEIIKSYEVGSVFCNEDYEPYGQERDKKIKDLLATEQITFYQEQDHVICHPSEIFKVDHSPYTVYTPYSNKWKEVVSKKTIPYYPSEKFLNNTKQVVGEPLSLKEIGFTKSTIVPPSYNISQIQINNYEETRDYPSIEGTSHISTYLRFGILSIREVYKNTEATSSIFMNELIWREFFISILYHFPPVVNHSFKKKYDNIDWRNNEEEFQLWKLGKTGYPIVDAGMRELNSTGLMHNRVRMIVASFLCKHLLIDWRWGEAYFATKLLDFELASNNGNWQWASGSGCDSVPYFRIFNPTLQMKRFDPQNKYTKQWVPEFDTKNYMHPMVEHTFARKRALEVYSKALKI
ncbi:deoxyribodipyrimidine photo-lyase [Apibacter muscae]|uniref:Deoxyribodipyrimidine photo-lyase n=1 Tax=Apibacter muscae TaxID=2509004 RepID=A0A563DDD6_9FLAO|nr:deoxyribodipyrimidine photo-lyase [Apibacter muscae]TWP28318.1 deoxyribodipyrimidine photo-lyase [Apibacter muscae]